MPPPQILNLPFPPLAITCLPSLIISQHPPAWKQTASAERAPSGFLAHGNLGHLHRSVRICLKITRSISLERIMLAYVGSHALVAAKCYH